MKTEQTEVRFYECKPCDPRPAFGGWAPGEYMCECLKCHCGFIGDKRAYKCADCAYEDSECPTHYDPLVGCQHPAQNRGRLCRCCKIELPKDWPAECDACDTCLCSHSEPPKEPSAEKWEMVIGRGPDSRVANYYFVHIHNRDGYLFTIYAALEWKVKQLATRIVEAVNCFKNDAEAIENLCLHVKELEEKVFQKDATIAELRAIFPEILQAIGTGACTATVSLDFLRQIPNEVRLVIQSKDHTIAYYAREIERLNHEKAEQSHQIETLLKNVSEAGNQIAE
jgi:hypothetical protein